MTCPDPARLDPRELYDVLIRILDRTHPYLRSLRTLRWEMSLDWYLAFRRAALPIDASDEDRDETKWILDPEDMVLGYLITVTAGAGMPRLVSEEAVPAYENLRRP